jgi:hypothetical protein
MMNSHYSRFTTDKLLDFLNALTVQSPSRSAYIGRKSFISRLLLQRKKQIRY